MVQCFTVSFAKANIYFVFEKEGEDDLTVYSADTTDSRLWGGWFESEFEGNEWQLSGLPGNSLYHTIHQVFALRRKFYAVLSCVFVCFPPFFSVCDIRMNLVFQASFVLKVGVCFLIGAKFSELCFWFLVGDKMLVSLYHWSARFVKCIYKNCMHRTTWSV